MAFEFGPGQAATPVPEADSADTGATVATPVGDGATNAGPATLPDTSATRALSAALAAHPGSTVATPDPPLAHAAAVDVPETKYTKVGEDRIAYQVLMTGVRSLAHGGR